jgi:hypothetical protein
MSIEAVAEATNYRTVKLPPLGTHIPHLGGIFWALMRAKPGSGQADYPIIVPPGPEFETVGEWGGYGEEEPGAACMWDGLANTQALVASRHAHFAAEFCDALNTNGLPPLYLPSLRESAALFAAGCDAFSPDHWYWTSTQYSRDLAYGQHFGHGYTYIYYESWEGGRARAVRRCSIESLID